jgi:hypothetical protein
MPTSHIIRNSWIRTYGILRTAVAGYQAQLRSTVTL